MARIPEHDEFPRLWSALPPADRRRILRAVNRGEALELRREAALAVLLARRQQRFWRVAWLFGPVLATTVALVIDLDGGLVRLAANALLGTAVLMGMSVWFMRRARRAEEANHDRAVHGRRST